MSEWYKKYLNKNKIISEFFKAQQPIWMPVLHQGLGSESRYIDAH